MLPLYKTRTSSSSFVRNFTRDGDDAKGLLKKRTTLSPRIVLFLLLVLVFYFFYPSKSPKPLQKPPPITQKPHETVQNYTTEVLPTHPSNFSKNPPFLSTQGFSESQQNYIWSLRRNQVYNAFSHAWDGYTKYAWGFDELSPISKHGTNWLYMDALDTALILNNTAIYEKARSWVSANNLKMDADVDANVFETTIRVLGGLLSAYTLSNDVVFLNNAVLVADKLLPAFDTPSGIPYSSSARPSTSPGGVSSTAEATSIQLEFKYLTYLTNDPKYWNAAQKAMKAVVQLRTPYDDGLVPIYLSTAGAFVGSEIRLGSRSDSYYEYLAKLFLQTNQTEEIYLQAYRKAVHQGMIGHLLSRTSSSGLWFFQERSGMSWDSSSPSDKFDHLVCYIGGMLASMSNRTIARNATEVELNKLELELGKEITRSCYEMYHQTSSGLASEIVFWKSGNESEIKEHVKKFVATGKLDSSKRVDDEAIELDFDIHAMDTHNLLRPEAVESFYHLYKVTRDEKYREWGWRVFRGFEQWSKVESGGYTSLSNVNVMPPPARDHMESFFLGETLKYLWLLFSDDDVVERNGYIFNTECHVFPVFEIKNQTLKKLLN